MKLLQSVFVTQINIPDTLGLTSEQLCYVPSQMTMSTTMAGYPQGR